jgi:hypothetical protein
MGEVKSQEEGLESFLSFCMYCGIHRNDAGFWEQIYKFNESIPESRRNYGPCPEGFQDHFPDEYVSLYEEKRNTVKEKILSKKRGLFGCFFIVNNKGFLFGDYDKNQRI